MVLRCTEYFCYNSNNNKKEKKLYDEDYRTFIELIIDFCFVLFTVCEVGHLMGADMLRSHDCHDAAWKK